MPPGNIIKIFMVIAFHLKGKTKKNGTYILQVWNSNMSIKKKQIVTHQIEKCNNGNLRISVAIKAIRFS